MDDARQHTAGSSSTGDSLVDLSSPRAGGTNEAPPSSVLRNTGLLGPGGPGGPGSSTKSPEEDEQRAPLLPPIREGASSPAPAQRKAGAAAPEEELGVRDRMKIFQPKERNEAGQAVMTLSDLKKFAKSKKKQEELLAGTASETRTTEGKKKRNCWRGRRRRGPPTVRSLIYPHACEVDILPPRMLHQNALTLVTR